jgi:hypothetical protein
MAIQIAVSEEARTRVIDGDDYSGSVAVRLR